MDPRIPEADEPELDLYTIPIHSSWFSWDEIHETEKSALKEFFDGTSISRTPRIYKEYRDFIINKYREDSSTRLTFTDVRKSLVGDVNLIHKVFLFLEQWGLINFATPSDANNLVEVELGETPIKIEDRVPNGVRVGAMPNSVKPISAPPVVEDNAAILHHSGSKFPSLTSYSDVFSDLLKQKNVVCGNCGERCGSGYYQCNKDGYLICINCFNNGNYGDQRNLDDFKFNDCVEESGHSGAMWTDAETLLLLECVLKHGDDWDLVTQNLQTKTKLDCILKLVELPFGNFLLRCESEKKNAIGPNVNVSSEKEAEKKNAIGPGNNVSTEKETENKNAIGPDDNVSREKEAENKNVVNPDDNVGSEKEAENKNAICPDDNVSSEKEEEKKNASSEKEVRLSPSYIHELAGTENQSTKDMSEDEDAENQGPSKRQCIASVSDASSSLMKQVALISSMAGPHVMAAAAAASVTALCDKNLCSKEIFDSQNLFLNNGLCSATSNHEAVRVLDNEDLMAEERPAESVGDITSLDKDDVPLMLRVRAGVATALGAAAAHSKLLADQEEREMEYLLAIIIETQMKKLQRKMKHFEDLELIMDEEQGVIEEVEEKLLMERVNVLQSAFNLGISRWKDHPSVRP